ncbi:MAG: 5,10-methylenetetrahydrofolate reductase [Candidatus Hydrothermota bacterium]|nr:MAG: 5,10-methylenetetrahydrofolate reductase [Candidatus Hydrothermae bacterium]
MIITKQKDLDNIVEMISGDPVFIVGCSECATLCNTGGEKEVLEMKKYLEERKIRVTGWVVLEPACNLQNDKRIFRKYKNKLDNTSKILVLACGNGVQTVAEIFDNIDIIPGTDTLFLGETKRIGDFEKRCNLCGECITHLFGGFCPISRCPKSMLNGPCGGSVNGKCEVNKDVDCVWDLIVKRFKKKGELDKLKQINAPKDWSKSTEMFWRSR